MSRTLNMIGHSFWHSWGQDGFFIIGGDQRDITCHGIKFLLSYISKKKIAEEIV